MANIKLGAMIADIRGSIGGTCFSRGAGGAIARNSPKPCNPRTALQAVLRARVAQLAQMWSGSLTPTERTAWRAYAAETAWLNKVGTAAQITGLAAFVRLNTLRLQAGLTVVTAAPTANGWAGTPTFTILANPTTDMIKITLPSAPYVNNVADHTMLFFLHAPTNAGHAKPSPTKRYWFKAVGNVAVPPTWSADSASLFPFAAGQIMSLTGIYIDPTNRIGSPFTAQFVAAAP